MHHAKLKLSDQMCVSRLPEKTKKHAKTCQNGKIALLKKRKMHAKTREIGTIALLINSVCLIFLQLSG